MRSILEMSRAELKCSKRLIYVSLRLLGEYPPPHCLISIGGIELLIHPFYLDPLAYITAKAHNLTDECEAILAASGMTEDQISLPSMGKPADVPPVIVPTFKANWPVKASSSSSFVRALLGEEDGDDEEEDDEEGEGGEGGEDEEDDGELVDVEPEDEEGAEGEEDLLG